MKIKQLILLKSNNVSNRKIAAEIGIDWNTVNEYFRKLSSSGYGYEELKCLTECYSHNEYRSNHRNCQDTDVVITGNGYD